MPEHELQKERADRLYEDELYASLEEASSETLWDPPTDGSEFSDEIEAHVETAREEIQAALELRRAEVSSDIITELEGDWNE